MLTFNLKKQWFDKIKSGEKTHEYRECKPYWKKRLYPSAYKNGKLVGINRFVEIGFSAIYHKTKTPDICFKMGYPKSNETDKILYGQIKTIKIVNGKNTDLAIDRDVYDIEFELIGDKENVCKD